MAEALSEDLGRAGDITSAATIPADATASAVIAAREAGVIAGLALAEAAFRQMDAGISFNARRLRRRGGRAPARSSRASPAMPARILSAERVALNYLCHLSGIATLTRRYADAVAHTKARITCTRKTIPGLRAFEKYAVRCGGGSNHRFGLDDAILIKDNHIAVAGGVGEAIRRAKAFAGHLVKIEVEVDTLDQLKEALAAGDGRGSPRQHAAGDAEAGGRTRARDERCWKRPAASRFETVAAIAETGVDFISSGALTHSPRALDLGLDIEVGV